MTPRNLTMTLRSPLLYQLLVFSFMILVNPAMLPAQPLSQTIKGKVVDQDTKAVLIGANLQLRNTDPVKGAVSDLNGEFRIYKVPVGRYDLQISYIGYETLIVPEVLVHSAKEVVVNVQLKQALIEGQVVQVEGTVAKSDRFTMVARKDMQKILEEQKLQLSGLLSEAQTVELGNLMGADLLLSGELFQQSGSYDLFLKLFRVETGEILAITKIVMDQNLGL